MVPLRLKMLWLICGWLMVATVVMLSLIPFSQGHAGSGDKLNHLIAYFSLMAWFGALYPRRLHVYLLAGLILLGIMMEGLQGLTAYRHPSLLDIAANTAGLVLAWFVVRGKLRPLLAWLERQLFNQRHE